jgi:hypothetical protein
VLGFFFGNNNLVMTYLPRTAQRAESCFLRLSKSQKVYRHLPQEVTVKVIKSWDALFTE